VLMEENDDTETRRYDERSLCVVASKTIAGVHGGAAV
jgi:hypothetical protein